ncbi:hypothetical protein P879_03457 [Paragonimus westermani]|uniref:FCP1 homology domain-containing protein n=1 Tax=Paragonimus westermani TaxID=34504 RepID=A0A8T0DR63_9TREM|nr:hypothetical protein P879_03457 [Paragonimus westermani]
MLDVHNGDRPASISSRTSCDDLSIEDCERLVLSPHPVPMNLDTACAAIYAAARRSNSSRTQSLRTQQQGGCGDAYNQPSDLDLSKLHLEKMPPSSRHTKRVLSPFTWRQLLCCCSSNTHRPSPTKITQTPGVHVKAENGENTKSRIWFSKKMAKTQHTTPNHEKHDELPVHASPHHDLPRSDTGNVASFGPLYRPTLPKTVLNALKPGPQTSWSTPHTEHSNSTAVSLNDADTKVLTYTGSITPTALPSTKAHSSFTLTFPRLPGFKHSRDFTSVDVRPPDSVMTAVDAHGTCFHDDSSRTRTSQQPGYWDTGDVDQAAQSEHEPPDFSAGVEQNVAQGDSSSENLELMTPGMDLLGELPPDCVNKKCLVLDLDETLVHSWFKHVDNASFVVPVELDGVKHQIYVCKRPHLDEFLRAVCPLFECVMFTASLRKYADPVCDYIDEACYFRHRLFREACVYHQNNLIKDLSRLGPVIPLHDMIYLEQVKFDSLLTPDLCPHGFIPRCFSEMPAVTVDDDDAELQIVSWFDDPNDQALLELIPYLQGLAKSNTVNDYLREFQPPSSAAVAQPPTPSWLLLFNTGVPNDLDENEASEHSDDLGYDYSEEDAVLSPHFHPPTVPVHSANTAVLMRPYLTQLNVASGSHVTQRRINFLPTASSIPSNNSSTNNTVTTSFIHQVAKPEPHFSSVSRIVPPIEMCDSQS